MGLAASQARLLFITSRQNDVSAQMQRVSNQNMILARDEDEVSEKYNRMLSATKLEVADGVNLSYDALMGASGYASGGSIISDSATGAVILSPTIAGTLGLEKTSGSGNDFLAKYPNVEAMRKVLEPSLEASASANVNNNTTTPTGEAGAWKQELVNFTSINGSYPNTQKVTTVSQLLKNMSGGTFQDSKINDGGACKKSYSDILNGLNDTTNMRVHLGKDTDGDESGPVIERFTSAAEKMRDDICNAFGSKGEGLKAVLDDYIAQINNQTKGLGTGANKAGSYDSKNYGNFSEVLIHERRDTGGADTRDGARVNLQSLLRRMLTIAINYVTGNASGGRTSAIAGSVDNTNSQISYYMNSKGLSRSEWEDKLLALYNQQNYESYTWSSALSAAKSIKGADTNNNAGSTASDPKTAYFENLFNKLSKSGWITDADANNSSKLSEKLKNNTYYVNGQTASNSGLFKEKTDTDATAKAEAYWKTEMKKIQRKEKQLDTQLTKLQTEYSSLTNDFNSVKSILDANVQKSFTYCQNG